MATEKQIQANHQNAQKSTGPRTPQGKAIVSQNALKHGLTASRVVVTGEDPAEFDRHRDEILAHFTPAGPIESILARRIVTLAWRLIRADSLHATAINTLTTEHYADPDYFISKLLKGRERLESPPQPCLPDGELVLGSIVIHDFEHARVLDHLQMYERRIENSLQKAINQLQTLQLTRKRNASAPPRRKEQCPSCHCEERSDEAISNSAILRTPILQNKPNLQTPNKPLNPCPNTAYIEPPHAQPQQNKPNQTQTTPLPQPSAVAPPRYHPRI